MVLKAKYVLSCRSQLDAVWQQALERHHVELKHCLEIKCHHIIPDAAEDLKAAVVAEQTANERALIDLGDLRLANEFDHCFVASEQ